MLPIKTNVKDREIHTYDIYFKNFFLSFYNDQVAVGLIFIFIIYNYNYLLYI